MICVSLGRSRHKMMIAEHQALAKKGAQLVELRLDWLGNPPELGRLLKDRPTPVVVTCRRGQDKGLWKFSEEQRQTLLRSAIVAGVDYVDLEEDVAQTIRRYGTTKRIVSHHDFEQTPENLEEIHARLAKLDPDIVKLVTLAKTPADNIRMLQLVQSARVPTIGFCMGDLGVWSRVLCAKYGSPFTYATFSSERQLAPGQLTFEDMRDVFHFDQINAQTEVLAVVADPVAHSLSPQIHNAALRAVGRNAVYVPMRIPRDELADTLGQFEWLGVRGYSVTLPHKVDALAVARVHHGSVARIGALNTLYRGPGGGWEGANTDCDAALESLRLALSGQATVPPGSEDVLTGKRVLLLGAGGVSRAIACGLQEAGAVVTITNRTRAKAQELARQLGCLQVGWENRGATGCDILINCTSVGMHPKLDETPFAANWLTDTTTVFDTVYTPERTLLIAQARERGCKTVTGVEMFVRQAARQFRLFTGVDAPMDVMRQALRKAISAVKVQG